MARRMVAPINANKHYVHLTNGETGSGGLFTQNIAVAVVAPATSNAFDVEEGSIVKAVFIELWCAGAGGTGADTQFSASVEKRPSDAPIMTPAQSLNLGAYKNKKNILYFTQGVIGAHVDGNQGVPLLRQWFKIPKGKQRMGLGDRIVLNIGTVGTGINRCGFMTYKEYR